MNAVKMAPLVLLVLQEKKARQEHLVSLAPMAYLEAQAKGVSQVSAVLLVLMDLQVKRGHQVNEVVQAVPAQEEVLVNQDGMAALVFQE